MIDNDTQFQPGQRVYDQERRKYGVYVKPSGLSGVSVVDFPGEIWAQATAAQLVAADEVEENG